MPEQVPQIPINITVDPQSAATLSQMAKDIDVILKALESIEKKKVVSKDDVSEAERLVNKIEDLKKKQGENLGYIQKMKLEQKQLRLEMEAADKSALPAIKKKLQQVNAELAAAKGNTNSWGVALNSFQFKFNALGNIAGNVASQITMVFQRAFRSIGQSMVNFEKSFAAVKSIMSQAEEDKFAEELRKASIDTMIKYGVAIEDVNMALYDALSSQVEAADAAMVLNAAARLSVGGLTSMESSLKGIVSVINAYSMDMTDADRVANIFFQSQIDAIATIDEMVSTFGRMNSVAALTGATIEEVAATFSAVTLVGLNAEEAVTGIRNIFNELLSPAEESKKALASIGVGYGAAALRANGFTETLDQLNEALKKNPQILSDVFGNIRGLTAVTAILGDRYDEFREILLKVNDELLAQTGLNKGLQDQLETTKTQVDILKASWNALWVEMDSGDGIILRLFKDAISGLAQVLQSLKGIPGPGEIVWFDEEEGRDQARSFFDRIETEIRNGGQTIEGAAKAISGEIQRAYSEMINPDNDEATQLEFKGYWEELLKIFQEFSRVNKLSGPLEFDTSNVDLMNMSLQELETRLSWLKTQKLGFTAAELGTKDWAELNEQIAETERIIALFGDEGKKKITKVNNDIVNQINKRYELEKLRVRATMDGYEMEAALLEVNKNQAIELAEYQYDSEDDITKARTLLLEEYYKNAEELYKKYTDGEIESSYDRFNEQKEIRLKETDALIKEYENRRKKEVLESGKTGDELEKEWDKISKEVNAQRLEATIKWAEKELEIIKFLYGENSAQAQMLTANIREMKAELEGITIDKPDTGDNGSWIAQLLGISDSDLNELEQGVDELIGFIEDITDAYVEAAEARTDAIQAEIDKSSERVDQLESDRDHEWERMKEGYANNYDLKQKELADERKRLEQLQNEKDKALAEEERRKRIQIGIDTALTTAKLILSAAEVLASESSKGIVGVVLGLAAAAALIAGFAAISSSAKNTTKYREGGYFELDGPSHEDGGVLISKGREAEGGEGVSVFSRSATKKYSKQIRDFTKAANSGQLMAGWNALSFELNKSQFPSMNYTLNDEYSRKMYELQRQHFGKEDIKAIRLSDNRTMIIMDGGRLIRYINHAN